MNEPKRMKMDRDPLGREPKKSGDVVMLLTLGMICLTILGVVWIIWG